MYTSFFFWRVLVNCHCKSRTAVFVFNSITFSSLWYQYCRVISLNSLLTSFRSSTWCSFHVESQSPLHIITWSNLKNQLQLKPGIRLLIKVINSLTNLFSAVHCGRKNPSTPRDKFFLSMLDVRSLKSFHHFHGTTDVCASDRLDSFLLQLFCAAVANMDEQILRRWWR